MAGAQCFQGSCAPGCAEPADCGGGYLCNAGQCERIASAIGDRCRRELDCGPNQACRLANADDPAGVLAARCERERAGGATGAACDNDGDCRTGMCALGLCVELCADDGDCPAATACVTMPRLLRETAPTFAGCLPAAGSIAVAYPRGGPRQRLRVPVPANAVSFAVVAEAADPSQRVGVTRVAEPAGGLLYTEAAGEASPLRYTPARAISTLLVPNAPDLPLRVGAYEIDVEALTDDGATGSSATYVEVVYRLGQPGDSLDLHFYFLDLADHPCAKAFRAGLSADTAATAGPFRDELLPALADVLGGAGVTLGAVTYTDILDAPSLDALRADELPALLGRSYHPGGVPVFLVRSIDPVGVQALVAGTPGTPGIPGTSASGIALSVDTLCYRPWAAFARTAAHAIARHLGLFPNVRADGQLDPIDDSDTSADNLLYFSEFGGLAVSAGQAETLRKNPVLR